MVDANRSLIDLIGRASVVDLSHPLLPVTNSRTPAQAVS
jgi:hypothetical protein